MTVHFVGDGGAASDSAVRAAADCAALSALACACLAPGDAGAAMALLDAYSAAIGRTGSAPDRPLSVAKMTLDGLLRERRRATPEDGGAPSGSERAALAERKTVLEAALARATRANLAQRVAEAERLSATVAEATKTCFALSGAREFPTDRAADFARLERRVLDLRAQAERTRSELQEKARHFEREHARVGAVELGGIDEAWDARIQAAESRTQKLRVQLEAHLAEIDASAQRHAKASRALESLPDFSRIAADPIEWLHTLANSFQVHRASLAQERQTLERIREEMEDYAGRIAGPGGLLAGMGDVVEKARAYDVASRVADQRTSELRTRIEGLTVTADEYGANAPASFWMALLMFGAGGGLVAAYNLFPNAGLYVPGILVAAAGVYFVIVGAASRVQARTTRREIDASRDELTRITREAGDRTIEMANVLEGTGCATPRELEALYESFRLDSERHETLIAAFEDQCRKVADEERQVADLFAAIRESYRMVGVETESEDDVPAAVSRAVSRYQEYRDAKRRQAEGRDQVSSGTREIEDIRAALAQAVEAEVHQSMALRQALREAGFRDENQHTSAASALRAFRIRFAQAKSGRSRIESLQEELSRLQRQLEIEEQDRHQLEEELNRQLGSVGAASIEEWRAAAEEAESYRAAWSRRAEAQSALDALLGGAELDTLRERLRSEGGGDATAGAEEVDALRGELAEVDAALAELDGAPGEEAPPRPLIEIDEDIAYWERRCALLGAELEATALAAALVEETAAQARAELAASWNARLAETAAEVFGADAGVTIEADLTLRIPDGVDSEVACIAAHAALVAATHGAEAPVLYVEEPFAGREDDALDAALSALARLNGAGSIVVRSARPGFAEAAARAGIQPATV